MEYIATSIRPDWNLVYIESSLTSDCTTAISLQARLKGRFCRDFLRLLSQTRTYPRSPPQPASFKTNRNRFACGRSLVQTEYA